MESSTEEKESPQSEENEDMDGPINVENVKQVLVANGGEMTNKALVKLFKKALTSNKENRTKFKNVINEIATVRPDSKGRDLIVLKDKFKAGAPDPGNQKPEKTEHSDGSPMSSSKDVSEASKESSSEPDGAKATAADDMDGAVPASVNLPSVTDVPVDPTENVRERARRLNEMEAEREREKDSPSRILRSATDENACVCPSSNTEEDNTIALDDVKRKWMILSARCDYQAMARFLVDHHHLAVWKNFCNGYTALHYAAKSGDTDCIKLLAGSHKAKVNVINHAGMTPLHLAAMHNRGPAIQLLVQTYKADPNIRDYRGKLPKDYLTDNATRRMSLLTATHLLACNPGPSEFELRFLLEPDEDLSEAVRRYLKGQDTAAMRADATLGPEAANGTLRAGGESLLRRSFRIGGGRPGTLRADNAWLSESVGASYGPRKAGTLSTKSMNSVSRTMSMPKSRGISKRQQLKHQKRIATSLVEDIQEDATE